MAITTAPAEIVTPAAAATARRPRWGRFWATGAAYALRIVFLLLFFVPMLWVWATAFKSNQEIAANPFGLPTTLHWENLVRAWTVGRFSEYMLNSVIYCVAIGIGSVFLCCIGGYALSMVPLPGRNLFTVLFLLGLMVPFQSVMIPIYYLLRDLKLLGTYGAYIVPGIALSLPFGVFLMRGFFRGLPPELGDAARVDGANEWDVFCQIMLPLSWPGLATLILFTFMGVWNEFAMPLIFVQRDALRPVSLGTMFFSGRFTTDRAMIAAGLTLSMIPVLVVYLLLQRRFIEGITAGALNN